MSVLYILNGWLQITNLVCDEVKKLNGLTSSLRSNIYLISTIIYIMMNIYFVQVYKKIVKSTNLIYGYFLIMPKEILK
jgi:hypothetical protein